MSDLLADADRIVRAEAARAARDPIVHVSWRLARNDPHYERLWRWGRGWWALLPDAEKQQLLLLLVAILSELLVALIQRHGPADG